ncbi:SpoIIE family protein phosphatase [Streptomyces sp. IB2014 016-6]|uniref:SpoIIE family protein phosphatase n=1 Tax=Streptomyces sp. IB2014 016-6 TaxID=2517818 RepID=UPI001650970A|nr:SpoIIE family protein phosphatase [Streptomyces sp. IB2014 016-6]
MRLPACTVLLCVTDGVAEARNAVRAPSTTLPKLRPVPDRDPERLIDTLFSSAGRWTRSERDDDMAVVAFAHLGVGGQG